MVEDVMANYKSYGIPLDVMWLDIPYMDGYADFSVNKTAFPDIKGLATNVHNNN
jgi:alpha-glucosidase